MICPPCTHFSFFFDCFCFLCLTVCIPRNCTFCYISFELRRWFLILFCGLGGRAAGWQVYHSLHLRGMPTCLLVPKCISLPSLYGVLLHDAFPDYRDTEWSKTIPLLRENRYHGIPPCICHRKKQGQASVHLRIILTRYSLRRYLSILRRIYIYIHIYIREITECLVEQLHWPATSSRILYLRVPPVYQHRPMLYPRGIATHAINQTKGCW